MSKRPQAPGRAPAVRRAAAGRGALAAAATTTTALALLAALTASPAALAAETAAAGPQVQCAKDDPKLKAYLEMTERMFVPRDPAPAAQFYAPEFVSHNSDSGGDAAIKVTPAAFKIMYEGSKATFAERGFQNDLILCAGPFLIARVYVTLRMTGPMGPQPPTGRTSRTSAIDIYRYENGKIVERWGNNDTVSMLWQLGLQMPPPPQAAPRK